MNWINAEFGRGYNLNAYRNTVWYTDGYGAGYFSGGQIAFSDFWGKRVTMPLGVRSTSNWSTAASVTEENLTWAHNTPLGSTCLVVNTSWSDSSAPSNSSTVTYAGIGLTKLRNIAYSSNNIGELWYLLNPPIGTYNITALYAGTLDRFGAAQAASLSGVTACLATDAGAWGSAGNKSLTLATGRNSIIICGSWGYNSGSAIPAIGAVGPGGTYEFGSASNTSSGYGKRFTSFATPIVGPGSNVITCSFGVANNIRMVAGAFG